MPVNRSVNSFRDLRVWQLGIKLVEQVYLLTARFPKEEIYGLTSQIQRAAVSVPSNIAEGHTREHRKEYLQHLSIAQASLAELEPNWKFRRVLNILHRMNSIRLQRISNHWADNFTHYEML